MKGAKRVWVSVAAIIACAAGASAQTIVLGPVVNPANQSRYYVVEGATWSAIRDAGRAMGGDLATIENATENEWVRANLAAPVGNKLWIGLNDAGTEGTFAWSDGSTSSYRNWAPGEPSNNATNDYTQLLNDGGLWAHRTASYTTMGVIEVRGAVRVPQEAATVAAGVTLAQQSSREVLIGPGTFNATTTMDINVPVTIRGSGRGVTTLNGHVNGETFDTNADFMLENMSLVSHGLRVCRGLHGYHRPRLQCVILGQDA
jgi:hypothetical protein